MAAPAPERDWRSVLWTPARHGSTARFQRKAIGLVLLHNRFGSHAFGLLDREVCLRILHMVEVCI
mgnify:CR=1 FL=1|tara:strand:- start:89 stop:283 length:195 start_codon:yes stop_codon:yes gene_type:complete